MFKLTGRQWLMVVALIVVGVTLQVVWILAKPARPPQATPPAGTTGR